MQSQEVSMCCFSTTKIFYYCLVQQTIAITHCRRAVQQQQVQQQQQTKYLGTIIVTVRNRNFEPLFNQELWISVKVGIWNNSGYTRISITNIQHILQCPLIIPSHVFNIKVDRSMLSINITRQQPMFQVLNEMSIATRLHEFFCCRRIRRN